MRDFRSSLGSPASLRSLALNPIDRRIHGLSAVIGVTAALVLFFFSFFFAPDLVSCL